MKKKIMTMVLAAALIAGMAMPALAFTQGFNLDDLKVNPGASVAAIDEAGLYGGKALQGDERDDDGATHFATLSFSVPADGKYAFWFLAWAMDVNSNSLFISIDGEEQFTFDYMEYRNVDDPDELVGPDFAYYETWYWMWLNSRAEIAEEHGMGMDGFNAYLTGQKKHIDLKAGAHTMKVATREPYAKYAGVIITDDLNFDPNNDAALQGGKGDPAAAYPDPAIIAAAEAAAKAAEEAAAAAAAAEEAAAAAPAPAAPQAPRTGDNTVIYVFALALLASAAAALLRRRRYN